MFSTTSLPTTGWILKIVPASFRGRQRTVPRAAAALIVILLSMGIAAHLRSVDILRDAQRASGHLVPGGESVGAASVATARVAEQDQRLPAIDDRHPLVADLEQVAALQLSAAWLLAIAGAGALLLLASLDRAAREGVDESLMRASHVVDALVAGTVPPPLPDDEGALGDLGASLRRLTHQMQVNSEVAQALADGAFRHAATSRLADDPMGRVLDRLTRNMEATATAAQRIARGDLAVRLVPQSDDDAFGQACSAMVRRVKHVLREVEETRASLTITIAQLRGEAETLASASVIEADTLRRTLEQVTRVSGQAGVDLARARELAEHAAAAEVMAHHGTAWFDETLATVKEVLAQAGGVQAFARDAEQLASAGTDSHEAGTDERARALAADSAQAAAQVQRLMVDGSESAQAAALALDRIQLAVKRGTAIANELEATVRDRATRMREVDGAVSTAQRTALANAAVARQLASRIDTLSAQARQLDGILQRFGNLAVAPERSPLAPAAADARGSRTSYPTPPHAFVAFPSLQMVAAR